MTEWAIAGGNNGKLSFPGVCQWQNYQRPNQRRKILKLHKMPAPPSSILLSIPVRRLVPHPWGPVRLFIGWALFICFV